MALPILTEQQRRAIEVLDWLYGDREEHRRTGRTVALAVSVLRRAMSRGGDEWTALGEDHVGAVNVLRATVAELGYELGLTLEFRHQVMRVTRCSSESRAWLRALGPPEAPEELSERRTVWERLDGSEDAL